MLKIINNKWVSSFILEMDNINRLFNGKGKEVISWTTFDEFLFVAMEKNSGSVLYYGPEWMVEAFIKNTSLETFKIKIKANPNSVFIRKKMEEISLKEIGEEINV